MRPGWSATAAGSSEDSTRERTSPPRTAPATQNAATPMGGCNPPSDAASTAQWPLARFGEKRQFGRSCERGCTAGRSLASSPRHTQPKRNSPMHWRVSSRDPGVAGARVGPLARLPQRTRDRRTDGRHSTDGRGVGERKAQLCGFLSAACVPPARRRLELPDRRRGGIEGSTRGPNVPGATHGTKPVSHEREHELPANSHFPPLAANTRHTT